METVNVDLELDYLHLYYLLGPILFNIFLSDLFLIMKETDITNYADDNTFYYAGITIEDVILSLQESSEKLFKWLSDNQSEEIQENVI